MSELKFKEQQKLTIYTDSSLGFFSRIQELFVSKHKTLEKVEEKSGVETESPSQKYKSEEIDELIYPFSYPEIVETKSNIVSQKQEVEKMPDIIFSTPQKGPVQLSEQIKSTILDQKIKVLSDSENQILTAQIEELVQDIKLCPVENEGDLFYESLYFYNTIPSAMVDEMICSMTSYWKWLTHSSLFRKEETFEEILKRYMNLSADIYKLEILVPISGLEIFEDVIKRLCEESDILSEIVKGLFPIKPTLLAFLWSCLLMELTHKYTDFCDKEDKSDIAKMSCSIVLSVIAAFTGFMHSGGITGIGSITSWVSRLYAAYKWVEEEFPSLTDRIPDFLKFMDCDDFNNFTDSMKVSALKGLNMAYTFRVGDAFLENLSRADYDSKVVLRRTLESIWPLPMEYEAKKMYRLYTEEKIYNIK